jgi:hypothetical protein
MTILGDSQAAPPLVTVRATNDRDGSSDDTTSGLDGSFVLHLQVLADDGISLALEGASTPEPVQLAPEESSPFPLLADANSIHLTRSEFNEDYVFLGVELEESLDEGYLEVRNLATGYRAALIGQADRDHDWMDWLHPDHDEEESGDELLDFGLDTYFGTTLWAEPGSQLLLYHTTGGLYSQSVELTAP